MVKTCYLFDIDLIERKLRPNFPKLPNHALMKFSAYFKRKGYNIKLVYKPDLIPIIYNPENLYIGSALYTPNLKRFKRRMSRKLKYPNQLQLKHINIGTPYDTCPITDIKGLKVDYTEYDEMVEKEGDKVKLQWYPSNIGFLTRGCKRHCEFCVNQFKDKITKVDNIWDIYQKEGIEVELLDDNLLASDYAIDCFDEIGSFYAKTRVPVRLRNGLDLRVLPDDKLKALKRASVAFKYGFHCAWDDVRNTFILKNIIKYKNSISTSLGAHMIWGVEINSLEEMRKDLLGFFYRYFNLYKVSVKPLPALYEDPRGIYNNPFWNAYSLIKSSYGFQATGGRSKQLRYGVHKNNLVICDKIDELLGDFSYLTGPIADIRDDPNFNEKMEEIANELKIKHVNIEEEQQKYNNND